jgi:DNA-binding NtrC family response regulator
VTRLRILLVDDDAMILMLMSELLADMGHIVCGTEGTEAGAVEAALRDRPDLMIVDGRLNGGNGMAAVRAIQRITAIPHILMSGEGFAVQPPGTVTLQKPFMHRDLVQAIARASVARGGATE